jgi:hypothetical protein
VDLAGSERVSYLFKWVFGYWELRLHMYGGVGYVFVDT